VPFPFRILFSSKKEIVIKMKIQARILGVIDEVLVQKEEEIQLPQGITLKVFFEKADKAMGSRKTPIFKLALKQSIPPSVMINGTPIFLPEGFSQILHDGDEVSILLPMAGG
jgi:molybdopterin converting factor small subunit